LIWALVRLPALAAMTYLLRQPIVDAIERRFDIFYVTVQVVDIASTPVARLLSAAGLFGALLLLVVVVRRLPPVIGYAILLVVGAAVIAASLNLAATSIRRALFVELILATNLAPRQIMDRLKQFRGMWNTFMLAGVGLVELLLWREYWQWVRHGVRRHAIDAGGGRWGIAAAIPGLVLTSLVFAVVIRPQKLLALEQTMRMPGEVQVIERGISVNGIETDPAGTYLYVTGQDLPNLRRYDLRTLSSPPILSDVSTGGAQGFAYDPRASELYVLNTVTRQLLYLDATTLQRKRAVSVPDLSPGDPWVTVDPITDTLTIASEADQEIGIPFMVLDRPTGRVIGQADLAAGNVLLHPTKPWLYLTFFRRRTR
jgi:hypothetical protein